MGGLRQDWDDLAQVDPLWAILSHPDRRDHGWTLAEFFDTGEDEVSDLLDTARELGRPLGWKRALDFGCGVGRITRALAARFDECWGVDISDVMIEEARHLNSEVRNCHFAANVEQTLRSFPLGSFDLVYSNIVLQHQPSPEIALRYVDEFLRVASPDGLIVFQLPSSIPLANRLQPRRRAYALLRSLRVSPKLLLGQLRLHPIRVISVSEEVVERRVEDSGGRILLARQDASIPPLRSIRYFVQPPLRGPAVEPNVEGF
jgi:SAM-dependent methyltransferase